MNTGYTKVAIDELPDMAAARGMDGIQARALREPSDAEQTGGMLHRLAPGVRQPFGHVHDEAEELYLVLEGSGRANLGNEIVELRERDLIRIAPKTPRCFEAGDDGIELFAYGPHKQGDGRIFAGWWGGDVPPADA